ncbi:MAG: 30S ribosomal protein S16 [Paludibacteraceae bacterium]|nr:30S ribosomal protein S16 [Paludibacteraceae bacterium]
MATKIRLARHGHKDYAYYHIIVADSRSPRDGKYIERIGSYNPNTNPATVDLNFERALYWVTVGAQATDTARNILSHEGVYLMKHLQGGVKKGAFDEAAAQRKFDAWKAERLAKDGKISASEAEKLQKVLKERHAAEVEANKQKAAELAKKHQEAIEAEAAAAAENTEAPAEQAAE